VAVIRNLPRPTVPQPGVPIPDRADRLPQRNVNHPATLWWLGVHGGAGETTLSHLVRDSHAAGHAWPVDRDHSPTNVVLVARSHASGLIAAQRAATEWASGAYPSIRLLGLIIVADAPGKLPKPLRELARIIGGGVPTVWNIPWVEAWRLGETVSLESSPKSVHTLVTTISNLINVTA
jgi:hypothetical protein